jgi:uncharacterized protein involved in high-affinity Fe2+ transport
MSFAARLAALAVSAVLPVAAAQATEYHVGEPIEGNGLSVGAAYLLGIDMEPMLPMPMGEDTIHLECDVAATADNAQGFPEGHWVPYLTCTYLVEKLGTDWHHAGTMLPMTAQDGPHYANNVPMDGPGEYRVTYYLAPPTQTGFFRHTDEETGVGPWWEPFTVSWTFEYPSEPVEE